MIILLVLYSLLIWSLLDFIFIFSLSLSLMIILYNVNGMAINLI